MAAAALPEFKRRATQDLMKSTLAGDLQGITRAVSMGADINATDDSGRTPLASAAARDHLEALNKLLLLGAKASTRCSDGHTALYAAVAQGAEGTAKRLLLWGDKDTEDMAAAAELAVLQDKLPLCAHILKKLSQVDEQRCSTVLNTLWTQNPAQAQRLDEAILAAWSADIDGQEQREAELEAHRRVVESQQQGLERLLFSIAQEAGAAAAAAPAGKRRQR